MSSLPASAKLHSSLEAHRRSVKRKKLLSLGILVGGLAIIAAVGVAFRPETAPAPAKPETLEPIRKATAPPAAAKGDDMGIDDPSSVAPIDLLGRAKTRALAWKSDSILISIDAKPVVSGKVDLTQDGEIGFVFGEPTGQGFGAGARVKPKGFSVRVDGDGVTSSEQRLRKTQAAAEPNCTLAEAAQSLSAAGVAEGARLEFTYGFSSRHDRTVWLANVEGRRGDRRVVDGWTCAIVVR